MAEKKKTILSEVLKREKFQKLEKKDKDKAPKSVIAVRPDLDSSPKKDDGPGRKIYKAIDESMGDLRFYFLEGEYREKLAGLFNSHESQFDRLGISPRRFLDFARESFDRFKQLQKKMPLEPMSKKAWEYMDRSLNELIGKLNEKFSR
ncbi:hypothetical protein LEP1GSC050_1988 [Leptospira broomii serovar Hurstbridge str. 5399]|uniref:Uncharacterized protein n=1 Tax=Leptospira broomii serovar Hurstbridge str. 5399 TaxID=1049789 RepID=T0GF59_9LEPT|nr:hypothetical protein [Leptospira broomii]EQA44038.1 hypothetical protein LEP1GSC050_1988 [Leptospira broomii serovar Hurstbridge str. 5399]